MSLHEDLVEGTTTEYYELAHPVVFIFAELMKAYSTFMIYS